MHPSTSPSWLISLLFSWCVVIIKLFFTWARWEKMKFLKVASIPVICFKKLLIFFRGPIKKLFHNCLSPKKDSIKTLSMQFCFAALFESQTCFSQDIEYADLFCCKKEKAFDVTNFFSFFCCCWVWVEISKAFF